MKYVFWNTLQSLQENSSAVFFFLLLYFLFEKMLQAVGQQVHTKRLVIKVASL